MRMLRSDCHAGKHRLGDAFRQLDSFEAQKLDVNAVAVGSQLVLDRLLDFILNLVELQ